MKTIKQILTEVYGQDVGQMDAKLFNQQFVIKVAEIFAHEACIEQKRLCVENVLGMDANLEYMQDDIYEAPLAVTL